MTGTYVYCIVKSARKPSMARVPAGLPGAGAPRALAGPRNAWLIAADVPLDAYGAETINAHLRDLDWVAARAMAHEAVVEHLARRFDAIPMKLFTIFRSDERALAHVCAKTDLSAIFRKIAGSAEWSVRVSRLPQGRPASGGRAEPRSARMSGTGFLLERKGQRAAARAAAAGASRLADEVYRTLSRAASGSVRREDTLAGTNLLLDAAFLVGKRRQQRFAVSAKRLAARASRAGCALSLTGPWPAYHFVAA